MPAFGTVAIFGAEPVAAHRFRQPADTGETVIVDQHDGNLDSLLYRRDDFRVHHQVRTVADHHVNFAFRRSHFDADAARDLVTHRREAIFEVIALWVAGAPQFMQVARQAARRAHDHILRARKGIDHADHFALTDEGTVFKIVDALYFGIPLR